MKITIVLFCLLFSVLSKANCDNNYEFNDEVTFTQSYGDINISDAPLVGTIVSLYKSSFSCEASDGMTYTVSVKLKNGDFAKFSVCRNNLKRKKK